MASTALTVIPTTQPSCGPISMAHWLPNCNSNSNSNSNNANSSQGPMGCFIQPTGFFCAPIATTRGFLYSLDSNAVGGNSSSTTNGTTPSYYIPRLSVAINNNDTNPSPPLLGVDGQPVNYQGPARLGQTCLSIPLPPSTDPLFQTLVAVANHRLNSTVGFSPGMGAGLEVLSLRGDCEQGSFCDLSSTAVPGPGGSKIGVCREQLPNFHNCTSYMQCLSLRCDIPPQQPGSVITARAYQPVPMAKRATIKTGNGVSVCMASNIDNGDDGGNPDDNGGGNGNGNGNGTTTGNIGGGKAGHMTSSKFPAWVGAIIAMLLLLGAAVIIGLARRRKKLRDEREKKLKKNNRGTMGTRNRDRTISFNEKANGALSTHDTDSQSSPVATGIFSSLFAKGRKDPSKKGPSEVGARHDSNRRKSRSKRQSAVLSAVSSDMKASSLADDSIFSMEQSQDGYSELEHSQFADSNVVADMDPPSPTITAQPSLVASANIHSIEQPDLSNSTPAPQSQSSQLSVNIPRITTTLTVPGVQDRFQDGESLNLPRHSLGGPPSFVSTASDPSSLSSLAFSSSRSSSEQGLLTPGANGYATPPFSPSHSSSPSSTSSSSYMQLPHYHHHHHQQQPLSPGSPISPISPISPRPSLSPGPSSRLSHRQSTQAPVHRPSF